jgi:(4-O-methyl)-D-glucuronate---lignin esterase
MRLSISLLLLIVLVRPADAQPDPGVFLHPPDSARPWVFWYWMQAAVSAEGIRADLQAMKSAGIGGAYLMPIGGAANPPVYTPVTSQLSPRWWAMVRLAMRVADSLGLQLAMHDCDGFAVAGGPWITPALSMQKLVWTRTEVGGGAVDPMLPEPERVENYYEDIAVLAFRTPSSWAKGVADTPRVTSSEGVAQYLAFRGNKKSFKSEDRAWIQYRYDRPFTCRSIVVHGVNNYQAQRLLLQVSNDGVHFRAVSRLVPPRHGWEDGDIPVTHAIPAVTARYFRFIYDKTGSEPGAEDLDAAKWKPSLKLTGIELSPMPAVDGFEGKSGAVWRVSGPTTRRQLPDSLCVDLHGVVDVTRFVSADGHLRWVAPPGRWTILRIGHTSTGAVNTTGGGGKGLECDKFNPEAVQLQFDSWFGEAIRQAGPELAGRVLKIFHVDSWECGSQNWSPVFRSEFRRRRGYDLLDWLPVMTGIPMGSADSSERFLHDVRLTIAELLHDRFYAILDSLAHVHGCRFSAECVAPVFASDDLLHYDEVDIPMGEFWLRSPTHDKPTDILDAVSGGHIYGKPVIQAEAFTELREAWDETPAMLKPLQDRNYALGINRLVYHVFMHNPWTDRKPGMTLGGVGTFLQRDQRWWPQAKAWVEYTQRCQWLLQQGRPVADIAVFTGAELPRRAVLPERLVSTLPGLFGASRVKREELRLANRGEPVTKAPNGVAHGANMTDPADWVNPLHGYAFDSFNPDALVRLAVVRDGRVAFPGGASYALLVFPGATSMDPDAGAVSVAVAQKLWQLVNDGATVMLDPAVHWHATGVGHAGSGDVVVRGIFARLLAGRGHGITRVGRGRVLRAPYAAPTLREIGVAPDLRVLNRPDSTIAYTHRVTGDADIYFVANQADRRIAVRLGLRVAGGAPSIWDPVAGVVDTLPEWNVGNGGTEVDLAMDAYQSFFIVLPRKGARPALKPVVKSRESFVLSGAWSVVFDTVYGGPVGAVRFDPLADWSRSSDPAIRYYSGPAIYTKTFQWAGGDWRALLDLGRVAGVATVTLNGIGCGTVWTGNRLDISNALRVGVNELRIVVANTWANRLTGDQRLPPERRRTWTTSPWRSDGTLLPAGLLGEVRIDLIR